MIIMNNLQGTAAPKLEKVNSVSSPEWLRINNIIGYYMKQDVSPNHQEGRLCSYLDSGSLPKIAMKRGWPGMVGSKEKCESFVARPRNSAPNIHSLTTVTQYGRNFVLLDYPPGRLACSNIHGKVIGELQSGQEKTTNLKHG